MAEVQRDTSGDLNLTAEEQAAFEKKRRGRSIALALALLAMVVLFYAISLVKGPGILNRPM